MSSFTRRQFVQASTALGTTLRAWAAPSGGNSPVSSSAPSAHVSESGTDAELRWLDGKPPRFSAGTTVGVAWPRGQQPSGSTFALRTDTGAAVAVQSWPLATWPDGSLKWTAHAVPGDAPAAERWTLAPGQPAVPSRPVTVAETDHAVEIDNGLFQAKINRSGSILIAWLKVGGQVVALDGRLVAMRRPSVEGPVGAQPTAGVIESVVVEQAGPVRAVVKVTGHHAVEGRGQGGPTWLPFVIRLYVYAGAETLRWMHTMIYDGDPKVDVVAGMGVRFTVVVEGEWHDRHVRFGGLEGGVFGEAVRGVTGLRRDPGAAVRAAQVAGEATPPVATWDPRVTSRLQYVPAYAEWTLYQSSCDSFEVTKRTREGCTALSAARGRRAGGTGYFGTPRGGLGFGLRNCWESYPAQLDVRAATADRAEVTVWLWSPQAAPMDLRPYHDGMGQSTYDQQLEGLEITYEDYEPGFDSPTGVARTSELTFWPVRATPSRERFSAWTDAVIAPPVIMASPQHLHRCGVFGELWSPVNPSRPTEAALEQQLAQRFQFYRDQQEQRRWYGFWNYGDVMHTYDSDRHEWRYDIGGFAWDNSELSTDLWLWLYFLRTGRADVFRFAEAMTRHTGEVDVYHLGRFAPLGSRHNVLHWGCSAKQLRISTAMNRRYYYYLTGDERVGDLMREQVEAARALATIQANRKVARDLVTAPDPDAREVYASFGTDWGALAGAWLTEWERTGDARMKDRLMASMSTLANQPRGFFTGGARLEIATGRFRPMATDRLNVSHLSAVFGLVEVCAELIQLIDLPAFRRAWLDYCELYNASPDVQRQRLGQALSGISLVQGHARLTAYAAKLKNDPALAKRAWQEFLQGSGEGRRERAEVRKITGPAVLRPVEEAPLSTNGSAQWGLASIQCLALIGDAQPE